MTEEIKEKNKITDDVVEEKKEEQPVTLEKINELLTNSLKWSQIIYEQNRKINRKLFWNSLFNYLKVVFILIPLVVGFFYILPGINSLLKTAGIFSDVDVGQKSVMDQEGVIENLLEQLPLDQAKKEQIKSLLR
ncbi:MAG: hypothetical protein Q7J14_01400 [Candidatus Magasanikbacteria bacterium]|nr:hypothetical protein [Candidatus Magasanikbacteria bacterium]